MSEFEGIGPAHAEVFEVDGEPVRVHGDAPLDDEGRAAMTEVVRAARRKFLADRRTGADLERWRERIKSIERVSTRIWVGQLLGALEAERTRSDKATDELLESGWRPPARVIESADDFAALRPGSVVMVSNGITTSVWLRSAIWWESTEGDRNVLWDSVDLEDFRRDEHATATVLHEPEVDA